MERYIGEVLSFTCHSVPGAAFVGYAYDTTKERKTSGEKLGQRYGFVMTTKARSNQAAAAQALRTLLVDLNSGRVPSYA